MVSHPKTKKRPVKKPPKSRKKIVRNKPSRGVDNTRGNGEALWDRSPEGMAANAAVNLQRQLLNSNIDNRRSINDECGYPETPTITDETYRNLYDRESIATRVVQVLPKESWQAQPSVFETEDPEETTKFEEDWQTLTDNLRGESWYQDEEGSPIWEQLLRIDVLSGIGRYGVLLFGLDDGMDLEQPVAGIGENGLFVRNAEEERAKRKILYLRAFDERLAPISRYNEDVQSPRFGMPTEYNLTFADVDTLASRGSTTLRTKTAKVHWSRVLHVADNLDSSEIFGVPRMRPVLNRLIDLKKLYGGSAEMYWRGAFPGLSFESHPNLGGELSLDVDDLRDQIEQYQNTLQRYLMLMGMSVKTLEPQVVDPTPQIDVQITAICIEKGIPKRKFMGTERGELASSQDDGDWNDLLRSRQNSHIIPRIIVPFVDRCIHLEILSEPEEREDGKKGYSVVWPDLDSMTEAEQSTVAVSKMDASAKYVQGGVEALIPPHHFLTKVLGFTDEEALEMLEEADETTEEDALAEEEQRQLKIEEEETRMKFGSELEEGSGHKEEKENK